jgi:hypothetical protein
MVVAVCDLLLDLVEVDVRNSIFSIEDLGDLFEGRALRLDIELRTTSAWF